MRTGHKARFWLLNLAHLYDHLFLLLYPTVVLSLGPVFDRSYDELIGLVAVSFVAFAAGTLPAGWLGDRWSRRGLIAIFFLGIGAAAIVTGLAANLTQLATGLGLIGLFAAIYHPVGTALVVQDAERVGRALGVNGVFGNLGVAGAAVTAGALTEWFGWRSAFLVPGVVAVATGIVFLALVPAATAPAAPAAPARPAAAAPAVGRVRIFAVLAVVTLAGGLVFNALTIALPKLFELRVGAFLPSSLGIGAALGLLYATAAFTQILVGRLIDRFDLRLILVAIATLQGALLIAAAWVGGAAFALMALLVTCAVFGEIPIHDTIVARIVAPALRSRVYAVKYVLSLGASAAAAPVTALVYGTTGDLALLLAGMGALALGIAATACALPRFAPVTARRAAALA